MNEAALRSSSRLLWPSDSSLEVRQATQVNLTRAPFPRQDGGAVEALVPPGLVWPGHSASQRGAAGCRRQVHCGTLEHRSQTLSCWLTWQVLQKETKWAQMDLERRH